MKETPIHKCNQEKSPLDAQAIRHQTNKGFNT